MWVHGMATFTWDAGDEAGRRLAAVQVTQLKAATQKQVAAALGTEPGDGMAVGLGVPRDRAGRAAAGQEGAQGADQAHPGTDREHKRPGRTGPGPGGDRQPLRCSSTFAVRTALGTHPGPPPHRRTGRKAARPRRHRQVEDAYNTAAGTADHDAADDAGDQAADQDAAAEDCAGQGDAAGGLLPVLPDPVPRDGERVLARFGLLGEGAAPVFAAGGRYPLAGLLIALPALADTGLLECARQVYGRLRDGYYSLDTVLVRLVLQALLREPRAEGATRVPPPAMGRILGLDRAPEVKTIGRKIAESAAAGKAADLQMAIAQRRAAASPHDLGPSTSTGTPGRTSARGRYRRCTWPG